MIGRACKCPTHGACHHCPIPGTVQYIRHAVSVDEERAELAPNPIRPTGDNKETMDVQQVWIPGSRGVSNQSRIRSMI